MATAYRFVFIALFKAVIFTGSLLAISLWLKFYFPYEAPEREEHAVKKQEEKTTFYFLGTSRVQRSISPILLQEELPQFHFVNYGLSNNSFLYSCQIASDLLQEGDGRKVIFIELTGLALRPSDSHYLIMDQSDIWTVIEQHLEVQATREDISHLLFYSFSIHSDIKKIIYPKLNLYSHPELGYQGGVRTFNGSTAAILTPERLKIETEISPAIENVYMNTIDRLRRVAEDKGSKVIYMLPLTIGKMTEFQIDMHVFSHLPSHEKWSYSNSFLSSMKNSAYLSDLMHLNEVGARRYSYELAKYIQERFVTSERP